MAPYCHPMLYISLHLYDTFIENDPVEDPCCTKACCSRVTPNNRNLSGWLESETLGNGLGLWKAQNS